ncbi:unnamed protein product [Linum trigynum]|uniref:Uncharacterized protein n=1 Tax=Linum trigynum TaxID=586398 RepID=A0AAV2GQT8_9ROSI
MAITKSPAEKYDAGSKAAAATTRASSPLADNRREGDVVDETESDDLQALMRIIMAMQLRTDSNMEEVRAEVQEARRERDVIMQLLTSMQEEQRRQHWGSAGGRPARGRWRRKRGGPGG